MNPAGKRVALVTGAARGMGAQVALRLAQDGYELAVADVRSCEATAEAIGAAVPYECDIREWSAVEALVAAVERDQGPIHAAVQVAGVYRNVDFLELDPAAWRLVLDVNVDGTFNVCRLAAAPMAARGSGSIVLISSTASWLVWDESAHYTASKAAIDGLVKGAAYELGSRGVRVNSVAPGTVRTPATAEELSLPGVEDAEAGACPLGRVGETDDVAEAVAFLCDPVRAAWVTGHTLVVDGGYSTHGEGSSFGQHVDTIPGGAP
ncbi:MAG TPA: SDR family oxidoreductase [Thermoleophilaceae bacterium]|nr:SDR family oxidoreductase [Thermoleophilaceae bacterium]